MKKLILNAILLATIFAGNISCSNDDDASSTPTPIVFPEENPLKTYITKTEFSTTTNYVNSGNYEFGMRFKPTVNGTINKLFVKIPDAQTNVRITIWDVSEGIIYRTEKIASVTADVMASKSISPLALKKGKEYMITYNSNDWYNRKKADSSPATYPITAGNISITGYGWVSGTAQTYPTNFETTYYAGDLSFAFQPTL
ncbi:DUF4082 domain-containing protein [Flavobacterium amnicola]|uniref:DUF4082 domain-containing protein n=1 Tax=Flavobacterium amnicola TaxID=2506422 RepID=A0A4Q1K4A1_9FLAO|nr:DUF4082 domain-containing protein [Flavobacterium amnicola]RXR20387.1 DUF4082 domain-containing protein [Flavobacterium amnicola]